MCDPTGGAATMLVATAAMSVAGAVIGGKQDTNNYNRQVNASNAEADAVNNSLIFKYKMTGLQQQQEENKAAVDSGDALLQGEAAKGTGEAAAASGGVEGNNVNSLLQSFDAATGHNLSTIYLNRDAEVEQGAMESKGAQMDAKARLTNLNNNLPQDPGLAIFGRFLQAGLQTGTSYLQNSTKTSDGSGFAGRRLG